MNQSMKASSVNPRAEVSQSGIRVPQNPTNTSKPPRPIASAAPTASAPPKVPSARPTSPSGPPRLPSFEKRGEAPVIEAHLIDLEMDGKQGPDSSATVVATQAAFEKALASAAPHEVRTAMPRVPPTPTPVPARASVPPPLPTGQSQPRLTPPPPLPASAATSVHPQPPAPASAATSVHPQPVVAMAPGRDEVRAMMHATKEAIAELDHMVKQMAARLDDPSKWSVVATTPGAQGIRQASPLPPPPVAAAVGPAAPWYGVLRDRKVIYAMAVSFAAGFGALLLALFCAQC